jgi:hypothetical protein
MHETPICCSARAAPKAADRTAPQASAAGRRTLSRAGTTRWRAYNSRGAACSGAIQPPLRYYSGREILHARDAGRRPSGPRAAQVAETCAPPMRSFDWDFAVPGPPRGV